MPWLQHEGQWQLWGGSQRGAPLLMAVESIEILHRAG